MTWDLLLADIRPEESPRMRCAIDDTVVADYAEQMQAGAVFPPITVFSDVAGCFRIADGHHRYLAAQRLGRTTITADLHDGTQDDAFWCALGANRTAGQPLTLRDKERAITLALTQWPDKTQRDIAEQLGCQPSLVSRVATGLVRHATGPRPLRGLPLLLEKRRDAIREMILAGQTATQIKETLRTNSSTIAAVRRALSGPTPNERPPSAIRVRHAQMRDMAAEGHTSPQIAAAFGLSEAGCRETLRREGVIVQGDRLTKGLRRHDSNRIMAQIVADAGNLGVSANFIDFAALDRGQFAEWVGTLRQARTILGTFIRRLTKEYLYDGEAATTEAVESAPRADLADACPDSTTHTT